MDIISYQLGKKAGSGEVNLQNNKTASITSNGTTEINPDENYDGMKKVTVTTNIPTPSGNINITDTNSTDVTNYATAQVVDADLVAGNIKKDVNILGVTGTYEGSGGGGDLSEYFTTEYTGNFDSYNNVTNKLLKKIPNLTINNATNFSNMFYYWRSQSLVLPDIDATNVTDMSYMFSTISAINEGLILDIRKLTNTSSVRNMSNMFFGSKFKQIYGLENLNTSSVTNMQSMFSSVNIETSLLSLNLSSFNTSNVTNMSGMFSGFRGEHITLDLSSFNTSNVTNMSNMFSSCKVNSLNLSSFNTSNVTNMSSMFNSSVISNLDLSKFTINSNTNTSSMFAYAQKIAQLDISGMDFSTPPANFSIMFTYCGSQCLQTDGAYANGIPYIYVKDATAQNWVLTAGNDHPATWSTANVIIKQS